MCLGWGSSLKSSSCKQHCWALIISRFVFVVFAFPMFPLPYPLSKNCLLLFTYIPSPCGGTHFRGQQQWRNHSASSRRGEVVWLSPALHFHYSTRGFSVLSRVVSPLDPARSNKKVSCLLASMVVCGCPHTYTHAHNNFRLFFETHVHRRRGNLLIPRKGKQSWTSI